MLDFLRRLAPPELRAAARAQAVLPPRFAASPGAWVAASAPAGWTEPGLEATARPPGANARADGVSPAPVRHPMAASQTFGSDPAADGHVTPEPGRHPPERAQQAHAAWPTGAVAATLGVPAPQRAKRDAGAAAPSHRGLAEAPVAATLQPAPPARSSPFATWPATPAGQPTDADPAPAAGAGAGMGKPFAPGTAAARAEPGPLARHSAAARRSAPAAPPVIHVTIDRIDVRAPSAPPRPAQAQRARTAAPSVSLADYLRSGSTPRRGGAS